MIKLIIEKNRNNNRKEVFILGSSWVEKDSFLGKKSILNFSVTK